MGQICTLILLPFIFESNPTELHSIIQILARGMACVALSFHVSALLRGDFHIYLGGAEQNRHANIVDGGKVSYR